MEGKAIKYSLHRNMIHELKIENGALYFDGFKLKGVKKYELSYETPKNTAELTLKMIVNESGLTVD